jgi:hypothetical protein
VVYKARDRETIKPNLPDVKQKQKSGKSYMPRRGDPVTSWQKLRKGEDSMSGTRSLFIHISKAEGMKFKIAL